MALLSSGSRKNDKKFIPWTAEAENAFEQLKQDLAYASLLAYPSHNAENRLVIDASDFGMGTSLEKRFDGTWKPLDFFSSKFSPPLINYSAYDRELTATFEAIRYLRWFLEGQILKVVTDHKPLIFAFLQKYKTASQRQQRQLSSISQSTTQIEHLFGVDKFFADSLSWVKAITIPSEFSINELAEIQNLDEELRVLLKDPKCSLSLKKIQ